MAPQRLYTLQELVRKTGRSYDLYDAEIRAGRLEAIQPAGPGGTRYVAESAYDAWYQASLFGVNGHGRTVALEALRTGRGKRRRDLAGFVP